MANTNGFIKTAMGALVIAIVAVAVILPIFSSAEQTEHTLTNEGVYYIVNDDDSHTLKFASSVVTVDGAAVDVPSGSYTILASDDLLFRSTTDGDEIQIRGATVATIKSCDLTIANGTISGTYTTTGDAAGSLSNSYTGYVLATGAAEPLVMTDYTNDDIALKGDSEIYGRGLTRVYTSLDQSSTAFIYIQFNGTVDDGVTVTLPAGYTADNVKINTVENTKYLDTYTFVSVTFDVEHTDSGAVTSATYTALIVPAEITAELAIHPDGVELTIIQILPVLVLVGVLMLIVTAFISNRRA